MRNKWFFTIPDNLVMLERSIVVEFIKVIPKEWTLRTGILDAPYKLINDGEALNYTKFHFGSSINQMIQGIDRANPDIVRTLIKRKLPGQVEFGDSSCFGECEVLSPEERVEVACYFVEAGYCGRLRFAEGKEEEETPEKICEIFSPRKYGQLKPIVFEINMNERLDPNWAFDLFEFAKKCLQPFESQPAQR